MQFTISIRKWIAWELAVIARQHASQIKHWYLREYSFNLPSYSRKWLVRTLSKYIPIFCDEIEPDTYEIMTCIGMCIAWAIIFINCLQCIGMLVWLESISINCLQCIGMLVWLLSIFINCLQCIGMLVWLESIFINCLQCIGMLVWLEKVCMFNSRLSQGMSSLGVPSLTWIHCFCQLPASWSWLQKVSASSLHVFSQN